MSGPSMVVGEETQIRYLPEPVVIRTTLFDDSVTCVRGKEWAGLEGDPCWVVDGEGVVCAEHVTDEERARAVPPH